MNFVKAPDWPESAKLTDVGKYDTKRVITIIHINNMMPHGYYEVWQGDSCVYQGGFGEAKRHALDAQGKNGRPIEREVVPV